MSQREPIEAKAAQRRAIDPMASVWVEASAGSGKTTVLTNRALTLLLNRVAPERLLCLTFTKVAAAEMANRIAGQLARWATMVEEKLSAELAQLTGEWPDDARLACARGLFARVLDCQGGLKIQTIHSFCQSVLARFPLEAGVSPHFLLLDETAAVEELTQARRLVLIKARSGADPLLTAALARVAERAESEGFAHLLDGVIAERGRLRRLLADKGGVAGTVAALAACLRIAPDSTQEQVMEQAWAKLQGEAATWRRLADGLAVLGKVSATTAAGRLRAALAAGNAVDGMRLLADALLTKKGEARKISAKCPPALASDWQECIGWFLQIRSCGKSAGILALSSALLYLAEAVLGAYDQAKRSRAWLDFDDLILATRRLFEREGGVSWALYKLDGGIDHVLVDEAQDTNPDQWAVIAALAREFFTGHGAVERQRSLFVVGDAKQSIFSFQRADPKAFLQMQEVFRQWVSDAGQIWREVPLEYSFRSLPAVLQAVDTVFARERAARGVAEPGSLRHRATRAGQPGLVELWPLARATLEEDEEPWSLPRHRLFVESADSRLARLIAARIQRWLEDGEWLSARQRPMQAGDILVLVRKRGVFGDVLVRALKQRGIAVAGQDRMRLTGQLAVMDLMALGRFLLLPEDDLTLAALLKSPLIGLGEEALLHLAARRGEQSLWSRLRCLAEEGESDFAAARDYLNHWLRRVDFQPPYELFADVLAQGGRMRLLERLGEEAADPIDEFLTRCLIHERDRQPSLQGLLHWLESTEPEIKRESDAGGRDEVRIMTVHGAKGLQAPVVILPDTTAVPDPARGKGAWLLWTADGIGPFWRPGVADHDPLTKALYDIHADGQQQEYRRLLYVAMTRAEDRLYIAGAAGKKDGANWYDLAQEALRPLARPVAFDFRDFGFDDWQGEGLRLGSDGKEGLPARPAPGETGAADPAVALPAWSRQPAPDEPRPFRPLSPSDPGDEPPVRSPLTSAGGIGYRRGRLVHRLLQHLPEADPGQWPALAPILLRRFAPDCAGDEIALLAAQALAVLTDPVCADLFGPGSRAEVSVTGQVGSTAIAGRIDRLAVIGDRVLAVDFKSNQSPPALVAAVAKPYLRQMALYRALLRQIYPAHRIETGLVWTDGPSLMWLPGALLDRAFALDTRASI